jgi:hypothetical protein
MHIRYNVAQFKLEDQAVAPGPLPVYRRSPISACCIHELARSRLTLHLHRERRYALPAQGIAARLQPDVRDVDAGSQRAVAAGIPCALGRLAP